MHSILHQLNIKQDAPEEPLTAGQVPDQAAQRALQEEPAGAVQQPKIPSQ
jgi:hypothetical protein